MGPDHCFQEKKIQFQEKVDLMKGRIADKRQELFHKWEEKSRDFIGNFMDLFSRDGRLVGALNNNKVLYLDIHFIKQLKKLLSQ